MAGLDSALAALGVSPAFGARPVVLNVRTMPVEAIVAALATLRANGGMAGETVVLHHPWTWRPLEELGGRLATLGLCAAAVCPPYWDVIGQRPSDEVLALMDNIRMRRQWVTPDLLAQELLHTAWVERGEWAFTQLLHRLMREGLLRRRGGGFRLAPSVERQEWRRGQTINVRSDLIKGLERWRDE